MAKYLTKSFFRLLVTFLFILVVSLLVHYVVTGEYGYGFSGQTDVRGQSYTSGN